jgi:hypothetical protein
VTFRTVHALLGDEPALRHSIRGAHSKAPGRAAFDRTCVRLDTHVSYGAGPHTTGACVGVVTVELALPDRMMAGMLTSIPASLELGFNRSSPKRWRRCGSPRRGRSSPGVCHQYSLRPARDNTRRGLTTLGDISRFLEDGDGGLWPKFRQDTVPKNRHVRVRKPHSFDPGMLPAARASALLASRM